ncbi:hypothetical protein MMC17_000124 [Xylographa soralifera]|nr:hypothetical protein [Xylographa soralifera]
MSDPSSEAAPPTHPRPLVILPSKPHTHTLILLHGLSTDGPSFGTSFLQTALNSHGQPLPAFFPSVKLIFPSGAPRPCAALGGATTNAWFDISSLADRTLGEAEQVAGLRESTTYLCALIQAETALLQRRGHDSAHIVLWGFSQGCAVGAWALLNGCPRLGAFVGMSGWLPFRRQVEEVVQGKEEGDVEVRRLQARECMRRAVPGCGASGDGAAWATPVFLGHGLRDEKVRAGWGEEMRDLMGGLGMEVVWRGYEGLEHWYEVPREIDDIEGFLRGRGFGA